MSGTPLEIGVKLFASVRETLGRDAVSLRMPEGTRVEDLLAELAARYPEVSTRREALSVAVNHELARPEHILHPGDEVALIPPVGGG